MNSNSESYTKNYMIEFDQALKLITESTNRIETEIISLTKANGRILAEDILSPVSIPAFNNSAMDGYAVNYKDLKSASKKNPIKLTQLGLTAAGDNITQTSDSTNNTAWKIMTGAPLPTGYDSIIPVENTTKKDNIISCFSSPKQAQHVRFGGEDFVKGQLVLNKNKLINANRVMALASLGIPQIKVMKQPNIAVFSTGKELVDDASIKLKPGQIRNSNMPYILEYLKNLPVKSYNAGTNYDDSDAFEKVLQIELNKNTNIIISTGAVSMGDFDFIPKTIIKMGGEIIFHKIKIRPGKPILFAKFPNGTYYFGLPGNPISATIGLRFFVTHLITQLLNISDESSLKTKLLISKNKKMGFKSILKANSNINQQAQHASNILTGQESFKIHPLLDANGWVVLNEDVETVKSGEIVDFYPSCIDLNKS